MESHEIDNANDREKGDGKREGLQELQEQFLRAQNALAEAKRQMDQLAVKMAALSGNEKPSSKKEGRSVQRARDYFPSNPNVSTERREKYTWYNKEYGNL